ncbi:hypothetical protein B1B00_08995 [Bacillus sp. DSM 27956]|nr:hypothetical protein B1B00_08995 [Bacillus sp. DSM 27956]
MRINYFSKFPFYTVYAHAPQLFAVLPYLEDQRTGGIIMKLFQELVYGSMIGYIFFKWAKKKVRTKEVIAWT